MYEILTDFCLKFVHLLVINLDEIRKIIEDDLTYLKEIIDSNELFPAHLLDGMTHDFFTNPNSTDIWLTKEVDNIPVALAYCAPERMTEGTYNLYLIAISKQLQGKGIGTELISYLEKLLTNTGNRILILETSGLPEFELTRKFYDKLHFQREAIIREFYQKGEDKL